MRLLLGGQLDAGRRHAIALHYPQLLGGQLAAGVADPEQSRLGGLAAPGDVEPVAVAVAARLEPFVGREDDVAALIGPPLDLDAADGALPGGICRTKAPDIEPAAVSQRGDVLRVPALLALVEHRQIHGD